MTYLENRVKDAVCIELLKIFEQTTLLGKSDKELNEYECQHKAWLVLNLLEKGFYVPKSILEKCIEYVEIARQFTTEREEEECKAAARSTRNSFASFMSGICAGPSFKSEKEVDEAFDKLKQRLCGMRLCAYTSIFGTADEVKAREGKGIKHLIFPLHWADGKGIEEGIASAKKCKEIRNGRETGVI